MKVHWSQHAQQKFDLEPHTLARTYKERLSAVENALFIGTAVKFEQKQPLTSLLLFTLPCRSNLSPHIQTPFPNTLFKRTL